MHREFCIDKKIKCIAKTSGGNLVKNLTGKQFLQDYNTKQHDSFTSYRISQLQSRVNASVKLS